MSLQSPIPFQEGDTVDEAKYLASKLHHNSGLVIPTLRLVLLGMSIQWCWSSTETKSDGKTWWWKLQLFTVSRTWFQGFRPWRTYWLGVVKTGSYSKPIKPCRNIMSQNPVFFFTWRPPSEKFDDLILYYLPEVWRPRALGWWRGIDFRVAGAQCSPYGLAQRTSKGGTDQKLVGGKIWWPGDWQFFFGVSWQG